MNAGAVAFVASPVASREIALVRRIFERGALQSDWRLELV